METAQKETRSFYADWFIWIEVVCFFFQSLKFSRFKLARGVVGMLHFGCHLGGTSVIQGLGEALAVNKKGSRETDLTTKMASLY
jgi:hypothetical protein